MDFSSRNSPESDSDPRLADFPPIDRFTASAYLQEEAETYIEVGEFYFRNPLDVSSQLLVNWVTDVSLSSPERRWGTLEMLALYALSAAEATNGLTLTPQQEQELVGAVTEDGPMKADLEYAARDAIALIQSGSDPTAELPADWAVYAHVLPPVFNAVCLVLAVLTLQTVHEVAKEENMEPSVVWRDWLTSRNEK